MWQFAAKGGQAVAQGTTRTVGAAGRGLTRLGAGATRAFGRGTARGAQKGAQAGAQGAGKGLQGAAARARSGAVGVKRGAEAGARGAGNGAKGAKGAKAAKGGLSKFDPTSGDKGKAKSGWGRQALDAARGRPRHRRAGAGLAAAGEAESAGEVADQATRSLGNFLHNRFRRRHGPLKKTRRGLNIVLTAAFAAMLMIPLAAGMFGAEAESESQEAALLWQQVCGNSAMPGSGTDGGSDAGGSGSGGHLSVTAVATAAATGLREWGVEHPTAEQIATATAIAWAESDLDPRAHNDVPPDDSYGLWQINMLGSLGAPRRAKLGLRSNDELYSPAINAKAMAMISAGGRKWGPWTTYTSGAYRQYLSRVRDEATRVAGTQVEAPSGSPEDPAAGEVPGGLDPNDPALQGLECGTEGGGGLAVGGCGDSGMIVGSTDPETFPQVTAATQTLANSVIQCFGRGRHGIGCYSSRPPEHLYEHPRGRACDFMTSSGAATGAERARGDAVAAYVQAHAAELHVIYVIWYDHIWYPANGNIPWSQWRCYNGCSGPTPTARHEDHVHVSIHFQPGDPGWARCVAGIPCTN